MTNTIKYSKNLIKQVKELYQDDDYAILLATNNAYQLGTILKEGVYNDITAKDIMKAKRLKDLKRKAEIMVKKEKLYSQWVREINNLLKYEVKPI